MPFGTAVENPLGCSQTHTAWTTGVLAANIHLRMWKVVAPVFGFLPLTWDTRIEMLASGHGPAPAGWVSGKRARR